MDLALLSLFIHVPLVTAWIGLVMLDVFAAGAPGLEPRQRGQVLMWSRWFAIAAVVIIGVTGVTQTILNPFQDVKDWDTLEKLRGTPYGTSLLIKHIFVIATFALTFYVRFLLAPRLTLLPITAGADSSGAAATTTRLILTLSIVNLVACVGALIFATRVLWELH